MENKNILIVEDDDEINKLLCDYLALQGYEIFSVSNGLQASSLLERHKDIDLVIWMKCWCGWKRC